MKKANEMRTIAEAKVEEIIQRKRNKANALVEGAISNRISERASMGYFCIRYCVDDEEVDIEYAIELMRSFGYTVDRNDRRLVIRW